MGRKRDREKAAKRTANQPAWERFSAEVQELSSIEAAKALVEVLRSGQDVGITPDGPRGPCYEMKPGALIVARRARARVVLAGFDFEASWRLSSWDGFHIPRPFSTVHMRFVEAASNDIDDSADAARELGRQLRELNPDRKPPPVRRKG